MTLRQITNYDWSTSPAEPGTGPGHQLIECPQPAARVYAGASGRQKIIASRHEPR